MNVAAAFLAQNWDRLQLAGYGAPGRLSWVAVTPRFRASAHVVFLALADGSTDPVLVAKVSRLPGNSAALDREAANLRLVQAARPGGFDSVPHLVAAELVAGTHLLVETGVRGRLLDVRTVAARPHACAEALAGWVTDLHAATTQRSHDASAAFDRLVGQPLAAFEDCLPPQPGAKELIARTRDLTLPLRELDVPLVFEHGDLSAPNILVSPAGEVGVVDWELAEPDSLPAQDLFFMLAYLAFARSRASRVDEYVAAFRGAFFGPDAWARRYVEAYAAAVRLPAGAVRPLFVACWGRYVAKRAARLLDPGEARLPDETAAWLRDDRFFTLWNYTVDHVDGLRLTR